MRIKYLFHSLTETKYIFYIEYLYINEKNIYNIFNSDWALLHAHEYNKAQIKNKFKIIIKYNKEAKHYLKRF